jgi:hypothetical protein
MIRKKKLISTNMINELKKNKVCEVINIDDDLRNLKHHLKNVYENLSHIIITTPNGFSKNNKLKQICSGWIDKITFVERVSEEWWSEKNTEILYKILSELQLTFDDVICFSKVTEIPEFGNFKKIFEHLKFEPVILRMTDFVFNTQFYSKTRHMGSICVTFSNLLKNQKIVSEIHSVKDNLVGDNFYVVDNGHNLSFFSEKFEIFNYFRNRNIEVDESQFDECVSNHYHPKFLENKKVNYITDFDDIIFFDISNLEQFNYLPINEKKIFAILNLFQKKILEDWCLPYQRVLNFNFTTDYTFTEFSCEKNLETYNIFLPKIELYNISNSKDFLFTYKVNEVKRKLRNSNLMNSQLIDIVVFKEDIQNEPKITFTWGQLKNLSFENVFNEIF